MVHRGPDSAGVHRAEGVALGIRRLRIIDLETGDQPIYNEDRSVAVVLNGEIYNFRELRRDLERRGHSFATKGDTEVIAHLYEEKGPALVQELNGMFAFALWDARRRRLLLARDRVGKKPLFYAERRRLAQLRLRASRSDGGRADSERGRPELHRLLPRLRLHTGALVDLARRPQAPARPHPRLGGRPHRRPPLLGPRLLAQAHRGPRGARRGAPAPDRVVRAAADDRRRSAGSLALRRRRLLDRGRRDGERLVPPGEDLLDRLRAGRIQRAPTRPGHRRALLHRSSRVRRQARRRRADPEAGSALRRAVRRLIGAAELLPGRADPPARHGGLERGRRG